MTDFDPTPHLPACAQAESRPMRQALHAIFVLMDNAPGVDLQIAALHSPGELSEQMEVIARVDALGNTSTADLREILRQARGANISRRRPANILVRPDPSEPHPWLFVDDLPTARALALSREFSALVIETSKGNCQVRLLADRSMSQAERGQAQKNLQVRLQSDSGSTSGEKWGRLPGFTNQKQAKAGQWTNLLADSVGVHPTLNTDALFSLAPGGCTPQSLSLRSPDSDRLPAGRLAGSLPVGALARTKTDFARDALSKPLPDADEGAAGWRQEFADACQALRAGLPRAEIVSGLAERALARGKRRTSADAERYASMVLRAAAAAVAKP